jgi:hypothetical protein
MFIIRYAALLIFLFLAQSLSFYFEVKAQGRDCVTPINVEIKPVLCSTPNTGSIVINWFGGVTPYQFFWQGPNGFTSTTPNLFNIPEGNYAVRLTDATGCITELSLDVFTETGPFFQTATNFNNRSIELNIFSLRPIVSITWKLPNGEIITTTEPLLNNLTQIGTYEITVFDDQQCFQTQTVIFTECPGISVDAKPQTCTPANGKLTFNFSDLPPGLPYFITINNTPQGAKTVFENLPAGNYTYLIEFQNRADCFLIDDVNIPFDPLLAFPIVTNPTCAGFANGEAALIAIGGVAPYTYLWPNGQTGDTQTGLAAGKYNVAVIDQGGCSVNVPVTLSEPAPIVVSPPTVVPANCTEKVGGAASVSGISGGTSPYILRWSNNTLGDAAFDLPPGNGWLEVIDAAGCRTRTNFVVEQIGFLPAPSFIAPSICGTGATTISLINSNENFAAVELFRNLQDLNPLQVQNSPPFTLNTPILTETTTFYVRAIESSIGCQTEKIPVTIIAAPAPSAPQVTPLSRCGPGSVTFSVITAPGVEIVLFTTPSVSAPIGIDANPPYVINAPVIFTNTIFYIGARLPASDCYSPLTPAPATVIPSPGRPSAPQVIRCGPGLVTFTAQMGDPAGSSLLLYANSTDETPILESQTFPHLFTLNLTASATFYLEVRSSCSVCASPKTPIVAIIENPALPTTIRSNAPICEGATLQLSPGNINASAFYEWKGPQGYISNNPNAQRALMQPGFAGVYTLSIRTGSACPPLTLVSEPITVLSKPKVSIAASDTVLCQGSSLTLSAPLFPDASYTWSGPNAFIANTPQVRINNVTPARTGVYSLNVFLAAYPPACNQISAVKSITVNAPPTNVNISSNSPVCEGGVLALSAAPINNAVYIWEKNGRYEGASIAIPNANANIHQGVYILKIKVPGCDTARFRSPSVVITSPPTINLSSNAPICEGQTLLLSATAIAGASYRWRNNSGFETIVPSPIIPNANANLHSGVYRLEVTAPGCPPQLSELPVLVQTRPNPTINGNNSLCHGSALELSATAYPDANYLWKLPDGQSLTTPTPILTMPNITPEKAGVYTLEVSVPFCPPVQRFITVNITPRPFIDLRSNSPVCNGFALILSTPDVLNATYSWRGPKGYFAQTGNSSQTVIDNAQESLSGRYFVFVNTPGCPTFSDSLDVTVLPPVAMPALTATNLVCEGQPINVSASLNPELEYVWSGPANFQSFLPAWSIPSANASQAGIYTLTVRSRRGCGSLSANIPIVVNPRPLAQAGLVSPTCENKGSITLTPTNYTQASYFLEGPNTSLSNSTGVFSDLQPGMYTATITAGGCSATQNLTLTAASAIAPIPFAANAQEDKISLNWRPPAINVSAFELRYKIKGAENFTTLTLPASSNFYTLEALNPSSVYEIELISICPSGLASAPFREEVVTLAGCLAPNNIIATPRSPGSVILSWQPRQGAICYQVRYGLLGTDPNFWISVMVPATLTPTAPLINLVPGENYQFQARTNCSVCSPLVGNLSPWSEALNYTPRLASELKNFGYRVYPNPASEVLFIEAADPEQEYIQLKITNMEGKIMRLENVTTSAGVFGVSLDFLPIGIYLLELIDKEGNLQKTRIVKQ